MTPLLCDLRQGRRRRRIVTRNRSPVEHLDSESDPTDSEESDDESFECVRMCQHDDAEAATVRNAAFY